MGGVQYSGRPMWMGRGGGGVGRGRGRGRGMDGDRGNAPSWLTSGYGGGRVMMGRGGGGNVRVMERGMMDRAQDGGDKGDQEVKSWCKERVEKIREAARGEGGGIKELKEWAVRLDVEGFAALERELKLKRKEKFAAEEKLRRSRKERRKAEMDLDKVERVGKGVDVKIDRLREYCEFIERGWQEKEDAEESAKEESNTAMEPSKATEGPKISESTAPSQQAVH